MKIKFSISIKTWDDCTRIRHVILFFKLYHIIRLVIKYRKTHLFYYKYLTVWKFARGKRWSFLDGRYPLPPPISWLLLSSPIWNRNQVVFFKLRTINTVYILEFRHVWKKKQTFREAITSRFQYQSLS